MDPVLASLMGTVIGGLFGIGGGILTGRRQAQLEKEKWLQTRQDDIDQETRLAAAELARKMAAAIWAMTWFTARAVNVPKELTQTDVSDYDKEMQEFLPGILGDMMVVSGLNEKIAGKMLPLMDKINSVDVQITEGSINLNTSRESGLKMLADTHWNAVRPLHGELRQTIHGVTGLTTIGQSVARDVTNAPSEGLG